MGKHFGELRCVVSTAFSPEDKPEPLVAPWPIEFGLLEPSMDEALRKQISAATKACDARAYHGRADQDQAVWGAGSHLGTSIYRSDLTAKA
jgi:hypothetical protein